MIVEKQMYGHLLHLISTHPTSLVLISGRSQIADPNSIHSGERETLRRTLEQNLEVHIANLHRKLFNEQEGKREEERKWVLYFQ
jgi:hypothetical protein